MARLPKPGSDQGKWGEILNDYLSQSHTDTGTFKDSSVGNAQLQTNSIGTSQLQDNSITTPKLADNAISTTKIQDNSIPLAKLQNVGQPNGIATLDASGKLNESQIPDRLSETAITNEITEQVTPLIEQVGTDAQAALDEMIVSGRVVGDDLVLTRGDGTVVSAGDVRGPKGDDGDTGDPGPANVLSVGTVTTLDPAQSATASITGTAPTQTLNLGIPRGLPGVVSSWEYYGPHRPDVPNRFTVDGSPSALAALAWINAAPQGATYYSVDGPEGAWVWRKRGALWVCVDGDTGWIGVSTFLNGWTNYGDGYSPCQVRRRGDNLLGIVGTVQHSPASNLPVFSVEPWGLLDYGSPHLTSAGMYVTDRRNVCTTGSVAVGHLGLQWIPITGTWPISLAL